MADIYWKTWEKDCFDQGSQDFFSEVDPSENHFFSPFKNAQNIHRQVILLACLPRDQYDFMAWVSHSAAPWFNFLLSLSESTQFFSLFPWPDQVYSHPVIYRSQKTEYLKIKPLSKKSLPQESYLRETAGKTSPEYTLKNAYLPAMLYDADRVIPVTSIQESYPFGLFNSLSSLFYLLPTLTQVEIMLLPTSTLRSQALVQAVSPILQKMSFGLQVNFTPTPFMVVSNDPLSADAYSAMMNSIKVSSMPYLKMASKKHLGISDLLMIHNRSERFRRPINQKRVKWSKRSVIQFAPNCTFCGNCLTICPLQALSLSADRHIVWNSSLCNRCGVCLDICPECAIRS